MNQYISVSNKEKRVTIDYKGQRCLSGHLDYTTQINPVFYQDPSLFRRFKEWNYDCKLVEVDIWENGVVFNLGKKYAWVKPPYSDFFVKVYKESCKIKPQNSSQVLPDGKVMIKGIGVFDQDQCSTLISTDWDL